MKKFLYTMLAVMFLLPLGIGLAACKKSYVLTFKVDNAVYQTLQVNTNEPIKRIPDPSKEGYIFDGWYFSESESAEKFKFEMSQINSNITLYAKWRETNYAIIYNNAEEVGAELDVDTPRTFTIASDDITLLGATREGYIFNGWYSSIDAQGPVITTIPAGSVGDKILFAKWTAIDYDITYNLNGGTNVPQNRATYTTESGLELAPPTRDYYDFAGWYKTVDFSGSPITAIVRGTIGNQQLYAKWVPTTYHITYNLDGGTNHADNPATYTIEEDHIITLKPAQKSGYNFVQWQDNTTGDLVTTIPMGSHGDLILDAIYSPVNYAITYDVNGGTQNPSNPEQITVEDAINLANPTKQTANGVDYTFMGWYSTPNFTGEPVTVLGPGVNEAIHLYAKWQLQVGTAENLSKALAVASDEPIYLTSDIVSETAIEINQSVAIYGQDHKLKANISGNGTVEFNSIYTTNLTVSSNGGFSGTIIFNGGYLERCEDRENELGYDKFDDSAAAFYSKGNNDATFIFRNMTIAANVTKGIKIFLAKAIVIDGCNFDTTALDVMLGENLSDRQSVSLVDIQIRGANVNHTNITITNCHFEGIPQGDTSVPAFVDATGALADSDTGAAIKLKVEGAAQFGTVTITGNTFVNNYRDILVGTAPYANQLQTAAGTASNGRSAEGLQYNTIDNWTIENNISDLDADTIAGRGVAVISHTGITIQGVKYNKYTVNVANTGEYIGGCGIWVTGTQFEKINDTWYYVEKNVIYKVTVSNNVAVLSPKGQDSTIANVGLVVGELSRDYYNHYANGDVLEMDDDGVTMTLGSAHPTLTNNYFIEVVSFQNFETISSIQINGTIWNAGDTFLLSIGKNAKIQAKAFVTRTTGNITTLYVAAPILATEGVEADALVINGTINLDLPEINNPQATINNWSSWKGANVNGDKNYLISNGAGHYTYHMITGQEAAWFGNFTVDNSPVDAAIAMTKKDKYFANGNVVVEYGLTDLDLLYDASGVALYPQWISDTDAQRDEKLANLHGLVFNYTMFLVSQYGEYLGQNTVHIHINTMFQMNEDLEDDIGAVIGGLVADVYNHHSNRGEQSLEELNIAVDDYYVLLGCYQTQVAITSLKLGEVTYGPTDTAVLSIGNNTKIKDLVFYTETKDGKTYLYVAAPIYATEAIDGFSFMINDELYCLGDGTADQLQGVTPASYGANDTLTQAEGNTYNFVAGGSSHQAGISFVGLDVETAVCLTKKEYVDVDGNKTTTYGLTALENDGTLLFYTYYSYDDKSAEAKAEYKAQYNGGHINYTFYALTATGYVLGSATYTFNLDMSNI